MPTEIWASLTSHSGLLHREVITNEMCMNNLDSLFFSSFDLKGKKSKMQREKISNKLIIEEGCSTIS